MVKITIDESDCFSPTPNSTAHSEELLYREIAEMH